MSQAKDINTQTQPKTSNPKKQKGLPAKVLDFASSMGLGVICLILLGLLVWFSTLEQAENGLKITLDRYYSYEAIYVVPHLNGNPAFLPLPGAYWVCAVLFVNLFLGGILRIRKGLSQIFIIIAHTGMIMLLVVGMIDHHYSIHGLMHTTTNGTYDYAFKQDATSIEVYSYTKGKEQKKNAPFVIKHDMIEDIGHSKMRVFKVKDFPFDIEVRHFMKNANALETSKNTPTKGDLAVIDGFFLREAPVDPALDIHFYGCYVTIAPHNGGKKRTIILSRQLRTPQTFSVDGTLYGLEMPNEIWKMPFEVKLRDSKGSYYPGTQRAKYYSSDITWTDETDDSGSKKMRKIEMNEPLRYKDYTVYQAQWSPPKNGVKNSTFEIVTNPADQWPKWCLLISGTGLFFHFTIMLFKFLSREINKPQKEVISE